MENKKYPVSGAYESEPSRSHYFSWINSTNEGSTENQTLKNLEYFNWLFKEYGAKLDIYAWDAGNLDGADKTYGTFESEKFKKQYPHGFGVISKKAAESGILFISVQKIPNLVSKTSYFSCPGIRLKLFGGKARPFPKSLSTASFSVQIRVKF